MDEIRKLLVNSILERIEVQPPYFAIENIKFNNKENLITAQIPIQHPLGLEWGYITAAEAGRHLAILGSCFLSIKNTRAGRFYYLAREANYESSLTFIGKSSQFLVGSATGRFLEKKDAEAEMQLKTAENILICTLSVKYYVFSEKVFERLYSKFKCPPVNSSKIYLNPYAYIPLLKDIGILKDKKSLCAYYNKVNSENCLGHFPLFPAMPIAILAHHLISLSGHFLRSILNLENVKYQVKSVKLVAPDLGFANEDIEFKVDYSKKEGNNFHFQCCAIANSTKTIGELDLILQIIP